MTDRKHRIASSSLGYLFLIWSLCSNVERSHRSRNSRLSISDLVALVPSGKRPPEQVRLAICFCKLCSPHLCVGFLFLDLYLPAPPLFRSASSVRTSVRTSLSHTVFLCLCHTPSLSHTHTPSLSQPPSLSHTIFVTHLFVNHLLCHTPSLSHTPSNLSHTSLSHTIFVTHHLRHTPLCHTPSFTHLFLTHHLSHTLFHTPLCHTHTIFHTPLCHTPSFAWQAWRLATSTCVLRGKRGTWRHRSSFCVAGVALVTLGWVWWCGHL